MRPVDLLFLSQEDVKGLGLSDAVLIEAIERALIEHANGTIEMPPKPGVHPTYENTFIHAMPAYLKKADACGMKWVAGFPRNHEHGLPNISGLIVLNDTRTGVPLSVMDCRWVTTVRTALVSALAARICARPGAEVLAIAGCGLQGRYHARTITAALPRLKEIRFTDVSEASMNRLEQETRGFFGGKLVPCKDAEACVAGADVIATCTPGDRPIVKDAWFAPGATGIGIEGGCAWEKEALHGADKFIVDDLPQAKHFETLGDFPGGMPEVYAELGELVAGRKPARESDRERILATPLGLAIEDIAIAKVVYQTALERKAGIRVGLMREDL